jgi:hypothetical protein
MPHNHEGALKEIKLEPAELEFLWIQYKFYLLKFNDNRQYACVCSKISRLRRNITGLSMKFIKWIKQENHTLFVEIAVLKSHSTEF